MQLTTEQVKRVTDKVKEVYAKAEVEFKREFKLPLVGFRLMGRTAGWAYYVENKIEFNSVLLVENEKDMLEDTVVHEIAHLISWQVYGREGRGHGWMWKSVMNRLGVEPTRCHDYDTTMVAQGRNAMVRKAKVVEY